MKEQIRAHIERALKRQGVSEKADAFAETVDRLLSKAEEEYDRIASGGKTDVEAYRGAMENIADEMKRAAGDLKASFGPESDGESEKGEKEEKKNEGKSKDKDVLSNVEQTAHAVLWLLTVAAYLAVSLIFGHWNMTWLLFLTAAAGSIVIDVIFDINRGHTIVDEWDNLNGILWLAIVFIYFAVSFLTKAWGITWVIFICGIALTIIMDNVKKALVRRSSQEADGGSDDEEE